MSTEITVWYDTRNWWAVAEEEMRVSLCVCQHVFLHSESWPLRNSWTNKVHKSKAHKNIRKASLPRCRAAKDKVKTAAPHLMPLSHLCHGWERWQQSSHVVPPLMITQGWSRLLDLSVPPHSSVSKHSRYPSMAHNPEKRRQVIFITLSRW